jgi:hypothetical protein
MKIYVVGWPLSTSVLQPQNLSHFSYAIFSSQSGGVW